MTPSERNYLEAGLQLRIATARLLLQISGPDRDVRLADLLAFARTVGDDNAADTVAAFHAAQAEKLRAAQAELKRLRCPDQDHNRKE